MSQAQNLFSLRNLALLAVASASLAAQAASGITVAPQDVAAIKAGMTQQEVLSAIGQPARKLQFASANGATWRYDVAAAGQGDFYVEFDQAGKVSNAMAVSNDAGPDR